MPRPTSQRSLLKTAITILSIFAIILILAVPAMGQLTDKDIEDLKQQGKREGWTFTVGHNDATKRPMNQLCGLKEPPDWRQNAKFKTFTSDGDLDMVLPETFDWRDSGGVTDIRNQGSCGSCWAFATVGALECNIAIVDGYYEDLSEQYLVSCNALGYDCDGGWWAHEYFRSAPDPCGDTGAVWEEDFPYEADDVPCTCPYDERPYFIEDWGYVGEEWTIPGVDAMKRAILLHGPISVAVYTNSAFQSYNGGIFNDCEDASVNHAVVLVGWDDTQGTEGVWIMRNSWGHNWGESGYMRIEYGCSRIGYNASYIVYGGGIMISADTTYGPVPLDVDFYAVTGLEADSWSWEFGDGDVAFVQDPPVHTYDEVGIYDVTVEIESGYETRSNTKEDFIIVYADTIKGENTGGNPDTQVEMVLTANNTAPVRYFKVPAEFPSSFGLVFDSFSTAGCRTDYFEQQEYLHYDPWWGHRVTLKLVSSDNETSPDLPAGSGPIVKLYFTIPAGATVGESAVVDLNGYETFLPEYQGPLAIYQVETVDGEITVSESCCAVRGDADHDGGLTPLDASYFVDWMWRGGSALPCEEEGDVDGSGGVDPLDATYLIAYFWQGGPAPVGCF